MDKVNAEIGSDYKLFNYYGAADAEHVIVAMGSACDTIQETVDYTERDYRFEMEGDRRNYNYENENLGAMGYQTQEFDDESEELVTIEDDYVDADEDMDFEE